MLQCCQCGWENESHQPESLFRLPCLPAWAGHGVVLAKCLVTHEIFFFLWRELDNLTRLSDPCEHTCNTTKWRTWCECVSANVCHPLIQPRQGCPINCLLSNILQLYYNHTPCHWILKHHHILFSVAESVKQMHLQAMVKALFNIYVRNRCLTMFQLTFKCNEKQHRKAELNFVQDHLLNNT